MLSFRRFLKESYLIENRDWHQFVNQNSKSLLDRANLTVPYMNLQGERGHGTPEHLTNYLSDQLGIRDLSSEEGRWVLKHFNSGNIKRSEDIESVVIPNLERLRKAREEGKSTAKLANLKGPLELSGHLSKIYPVSEESLSDLDPREYTIHGENEHWTIAQPHTQKAACTLGKGTEWCTASKSRNRFEQYDSEGPLVVFIPKKPAYKGERYQAWQSEWRDDDDGQFMDHTDNEVGVKNPMPDFTERPLPTIGIGLGNLGPGSAVKETINFAKEKIEIDKISKDLEGTDVDAAHRAVNNPLFGKVNAHIEYALASRHEAIALAAVEHPGFENNLDYAVDSPHEFVAQAAVKNRKFGANLSHALTSRHEFVQRAAIESRDFGKHSGHLYYAIKSPKEFLQRAAVENPNFDKIDYTANFIHALGSRHEAIALAAVNHKSFKLAAPHVIKLALESPYESVRTAARKAQIQI